MDVGTLGLATVVGGMVLFLWGGFTQAVLPWGIRSVRADVVQPKATEGIGEVSSDGMMYLQGEVVAFVAAKPKSYYSLRRFFAIEFVNQLAVGLALAALLGQCGGASLVGRQGVALLAGMIVAFSTDVPYWNWWGFSTRYSVGVVANKCVGLQLAALAIGLLVLPS